MQVFVIFDYGVDYNDETHEIGGEGAEVRDKGYASLEDAKTALKIDLKQQLKTFGIRDFGWEGGNEYSLACEWLKDLVNDDSHYCSYSYRDRIGCDKDHGWSAFITYCEANNIEWLDKVPQLLCIQEITV